MGSQISLLPGQVDAVDSRLGLLDQSAEGLLDPLKERYTIFNDRR